MNGDPEEEGSMLLWTMVQRLIEAITAYYVLHPTMDQALANRIKAARAMMGQVAATWQDAPLRPLLAQLVIAVEALDDTRIGTCVLQAKALLQETPPEEKASDRE